MKRRLFNPSHDFQIVAVLAQPEKPNKTKSTNMKDQLRTAGKTILMTTMVAVVIGASLITLPTTVAASGGSGSGAFPSYFLGRAAPKRVLAAAAALGCLFLLVEL